MSMLFSMQGKILFQNGHLENNPSPPSRTSFFPFAPLGNQWGRGIPLFDRPD
jgi:hypothetical protein